jgi:hypothetical protein
MNSYKEFFEFCKVFKMKPCRYESLQCYFLYKKQVAEIKENKANE